MKQTSNFLQISEILDKFWKKNKAFVSIVFYLLIVISGPIISRFIIHSNELLDEIKIVSLKNQEKISAIKEILQKLENDVELLEQRFMDKSQR